MTIESNLPVPQARGGNRKYPWGQLQLGDSFFVGGITIERISALATNYATRHSQKFTCRTVTEGGVTGVRVWRLR